jgi:hypothetical protein
MKLSTGRYSDSHNFMEMFVTVDATLRWSRSISAVRGERKTQNHNTETGRRFAPVSQGRDAKIEFPNNLMTFNH